MLVLSKENFERIFFEEFPQIGKDVYTNSLLRKRGQLDASVKAEEYCKEIAEIEKMAEQEEKSPLGRNSGTGSKCASKKRQGVSSKNNSFGQILNIINSKAGKDFVDRNSINSFASQGDRGSPFEDSRYSGENESSYWGPDMTGNHQQIDGNPRDSINVNFAPFDADSQSSGLEPSQSIEEEQATKLRCSLGVNQSHTISQFPS